jgi:sugar O-acyltransferase (sialic acid O-acetyltransferase NeuD family)
MTVPLILVAASGLAREALEAVRSGDTYQVIGFVDDDPARWGDVIDDVKVLGGLDLVGDLSDAAVLLCAGRGSGRASLASRLDIEDARYATVIHPSVSLPRSSPVGVGSIVLAGCVLTASVRLGRHVVAMPKVVLTHDDVVDDYATLCAGAVLGGSVQVGPGAYLGMNASVKERVIIGADAVVGMGSIVLRDVPERETWFGVPARAQAKHTPLAGIPSRCSGKP